MQIYDLQVLDPSASLFNQLESKFHRMHGVLYVFIISYLVCNQLVVEPTRLKNMLVKLDHLPRYPGEKK